MKNSRPRKLIAVIAVISAVILTSAPRLALAEEGGSGHYFPGSMSDFADAVPLTPTFIVRYNQLYYSWIGRRPQSHPYRWPNNVRPQGYVVG